MVRQNILLKILAASVVAVSACCFLGPYDYQFRDTSGLFYYYGSLLAFAAPLCFCANKNRALVEQRKGVSVGFYAVSPFGEKILFFLCAIGILSSAVFIAECIRLFSFDSILAGNDFRLEFSESRSSLSKVSEMLACLGPAAYLVVSASEAISLRGLKAISYVALVFMGLTGLVLGARWKLFVCVLIFVFSLIVNRRGFRFSKKAKGVLKRILLLAVVAVIFYLFWNLFSVRGSLAADEQWRFYYGDMPLKESAQLAFDASGGALKPLFGVVDYIGQAPFVFTHLFEDYIPSKLYFGAFLLRPLGSLLNLIGIDFPTSSQIANETFTGMYSGSSYGLIVDFGVGGALAAFFLIGCVFAAAERRLRTSIFVQMVFPAVCVAVACSPMYYLFQVGYIDYIFCWSLAIFLLLTFAGAFVKKRVDNSE